MVFEAKASISLKGPEEQKSGRSGNMSSQARWSERDASQEGVSFYFPGRGCFFDLFSWRQAHSGHYVQVCCGRLPAHDRLIVLLQFLILLTSAPASCCRRRADLAFPQTGEASEDAKINIFSW
ncbi:MAG: hypothetical protein CMJ81_10955 [Planctomycetaceae bacterium]|nr:hypothetical protein [Planctomycetaceae bacterium]MBP63058.1 hypothetical protein [Planctomycetaceae bacterium]